MSIRNSCIFVSDSALWIICPTCVGFLAVNVTSSGAYMSKIIIILYNLRRAFSTTLQNDIFIFSISG